MVNSQTWSLDWSRFNVVFSVALGVFLAFANDAVASYLAAAIVVIWGSFYPRRLFPLAFTLLIASPDRPFFRIPNSDAPFVSHSIYLDTLAGTTVITIVFALLFLVAIVHFLLRRGRAQIGNVLLLAAFLLPVHGIANAYNLTVFLSDFKYFVVPAVLISVTKRANIEFEQFLRTVLYSVLVYMVFLVAILSSQGFGVYSLDFTLFMAPIVVVPLILLPAVPIPVSVGCFLLIALGMLYAPGRGKVLFFAFALVFYFWASNTSRIRKGSTLAVMALLVALIASQSSSFLADQNIRAMLWKLTTINFFSEENLSANVRLLEFLNIAATNIRRIYAIFIGAGYGGWYTDVNFPFPPLDSGAFNTEELRYGIFHNSHGFVNFAPLKLGLVPTGAFYIVIYRLWRRTRYSIGSRRSLALFLLMLLLTYFLVTFKSLIVFYGLYFALHRRFAVPPPTLNPTN